MKKNSNFLGFFDRSEAGQKLAASLLLKHKNKNTVVLALPRGGVPIGFEIAKAFDAPLDVLVVRKLGSPYNPEFGIGAIAPEDVKVLDEKVINYLGLSSKEVELIEEREREELERRVKEYRGHDSIPKITGKTVILVDDGLATGVTARAAIKAVLMKNPKKLIVAFPVCPKDAVDSLKMLIRSGVDEVECLATPYNLTAVGAWYQNFIQVTDDEVIRILSKAKKFRT